MKKINQNKFVPLINVSNIMDGINPSVPKIPIADSPQFPIDPSYLLSYQHAIKHMGISHEKYFTIVSHSLDMASIPHYHDYLEITLIHNADIFFIQPENSLVIPEDHVILVPPNLTHLISPIKSQKEPAIVTDILISNEFIKLIKNIYQLSEQKQEINFDKEILIKDADVIGMIRLIILEYYKNKFHFNGIILGYIISILCQIQSLSPSKLYDNLTMDIIELVRSNPLLSVANIAQTLNYSSSYLTRHIKKQTGRNLSKWLTLEKLEFSKELLVQTGLTVSEISEKIGYKSESHFYHAFKNEFKLRPTEYRKLMKNTIFNK